MTEETAPRLPDRSAPSAGHRTPRGAYAKGLRRRREILDAAVQVYDRLGYDGTSLRAVADAVGVTHPAVRHHFGSREALFLEVLREADDQFLDRSLDPRTGIVDLADEGAASAANTPGRMALLTSMVARALERGNEQSHAYFVERYSRIRTKLQRLVEDGQAAGTIRTDIDADAAARLLVAAADGLTTQHLLDERIDLGAAFLLLDRLLKPPA